MLMYLFSSFNLMSHHVFSSTNDLRESFCHLIEFDLSFSSDVAAAQPGIFDCLSIVIYLMILELLHYTLVNR
jgi:hypothetical protein